MDKNEEKDREVKQDANTTAEDMAKMFLPVAQDHAESLNALLKWVAEAENSLLSAVEKDMKSILNNKRTLSYVRNLVLFTHDVAGAALISYFSADYLGRKLDLLEQALVLMQRQLKDLPASEDVKKVREMSTRMTEMDALMAKLKQMTDQQELEKVNAWEKIDTARKQVMRDIV